MSIFSKSFCYPKQRILLPKSEKFSSVDLKHEDLHNMALYLFFACRDLMRSCLLGPENRDCPHQNYSKSKRHIKKTGALVILSTWYLLQVYSVFWILYCMLWVLCDFQGPPKGPLPPPPPPQRDNVNSLCPASHPLPPLPALPPLLPLPRPLYRTI